MWKKKCKLENFGIMVDCSRNAVLNMASLKKLIKLVSKMGYNILKLYTEDMFEVDCEPYFGYLRGRFTKAQLIEIDDFAFENNVELVPCIQTLAHLKNIFKWPVYQPINDLDDILLIGDDRTYKLIDNIFCTLRKCFRSKKINIGMDEAHLVGLGKYLDKNGYKNRFDLLIEHLDKVSALAAKHGYTPIMWSDMFFRSLSSGEYHVEKPTITPEIASKVPKNTQLIYWDYYTDKKERYNFMINEHFKFNNEIWFAGACWSHVGYTPQNKYTIKNHSVGLQSCIDNGIKNALVTFWGDDGGENSIFSFIPSLIKMAAIAHGENDEKEIEKNFKELMGCTLSDFMLLDEPKLFRKDAIGNENPFKYMLFNDCFAGIYDCTTNESDLSVFNDYYKKLKNIDLEEWNYLKERAEILTEIICNKYLLGVKTRQLYQKGCKTALDELATNQYQKVIDLLEKFYNAERLRWFKENKQNGFEIQDIRLGGLIKRIKNCQYILLKYACNEIEKIDQLEENILALSDNDSLTLNNRWHKIVTVNNV